MSEVICNVEGIVARIDQLGDRAERGVSRVMEGYAELIAWEMERLAPRDTGALEESIEVVGKRDGINRRMSYTIQINPNAINPFGDTVSRYASIMEAYLSPHGEYADGSINAREGTRAKGPQAGGAFMKRAVERYEEQMINDVRDMVRRIL